jgi:hypothetical protein
MRFFATRDFCRRAQKIGLEEKTLRDAAFRLESGSIDAELGSGLVKQRIEREGRGRAGSARVVLYWKHGHFVLFLAAFLKSRRSTLSPRELRTWRKLANVYAQLGPEDIERLIAEDRWRQLE